MYKTSDYHYNLPDELIAQFPLEDRSASRLFALSAQNQQHQHLKFCNILDLIHKGDLLVLNDTKVIPARLYGKKATGGQIECLIERILPDHRALAHVRASKAPRPHSLLILENGLEVQVVDRQEDLFILQFPKESSILEILNTSGHIPLPSYIERGPQALDCERYQTVYAKKHGAVAAPTAGLHFDRLLLDRLTEKGVDITPVTLHVGAGTFQPLRVESIEAHKMHYEWMQLSQASCDAIAACKARGGRVIAVGTTSVRCLESAALQGSLTPFEGETNLFIYPGFRFQCVDALITNFHLPQSSLLMLVAAFAGYDCMMNAYRQAVEERYRFFSYGDAMFIY